jgi:DNA-binding NarL/FixJ family response regulator
MPRRTGIEVTRAVRDRLPVGVLVLTAYDDDPYVTAVQGGANGMCSRTLPAKSSRPFTVHEAR